MTHEDFIEKIAIPLTEYMGFERDDEKFVHIQIIPGQSQQVVINGKPMVRRSKDQEVVTIIQFQGDGLGEMDGEEIIKPYEMFDLVQTVDDNESTHIPVMFERDLNEAINTIQEALGVNK